MLNKNQIEQLFKNLELKHGQPEDIEPERLDECVEPMLSVTGIRTFSEEFDLSLEEVRKLTLRQHFWLSMELGERDSKKELSFEEEEKITDTLTEIQKAGGIIPWLEQRHQKEAGSETSPLLPKNKHR